MAITLNQLLKKSYHGELKCVAGHKGLDKEILGVNVVDNPEIVSWLYGGELILSTGYVTKNNPSMLNTLVKDLHRKGCVGLGFKVKRYFEKIPNIIISEGNKYGFPILEISYEMRMSDISRFVYTNYSAMKCLKMKKHILSINRLQSQCFRVLILNKHFLILLM